MINSPRVTVLLLAVITFGGCARYVGPSQDVTFASHDGVELEGTLVFPEGTTGKVPAVILLHGAEAAARNFAYRMHANIFLTRGMAVLLYDKRGAGESGGDHAAASYAQFIDDALAGIDLLRHRPEIDAARIGIVGASESGWLTPEIAERSGHVAFVINKSGPSLSWRQTVAWEIYNELLDDGVSDTAAREQTVVFQRLWTYYIAPSPDEEKALTETLGPWEGRTESRLPVALEAVTPARAQRIAYDPTPFLERLTTPTLYVYGSEDPIVPVAQCVERLTALRNRGQPVSFHVFEGEGHELGGVGLTGYQFVEGYGQRLGDFAEQHVKPSHAAP
jgi:hypothetical protein